MNPFDPSDPQNPWFGFFPAQVQNPTNSNGVYRYPYVEVIAGAGTANYATNTNGVGRRGTNTVGWAREINNRNISNTGNAVVWMRYRGQQGGQLTPEFDGSGLSASGGGTITVRDVNATGGTITSVSNVATLQINTGGTSIFNSAIVVSEPSAGVAQVLFGLANATAIGLVWPGTQVLGGSKEVGGLVITNTGYMQPVSPVGVATGALGVGDSNILFLVDTGAAGSGATRRVILHSATSNFSPVYSVSNGTAVTDGVYGTMTDGTVVSGGLVTSIGGGDGGGTNASDINSGVLAVAYGGTGATSEAGARSSLGTNDAANINTGVLDEPYGGTGQTAYNTGDILYCSNATNTTLSRLPIGSNGQVLTVVSGLPAWATP